MSDEILTIRVDYKRLDAAAAPGFRARLDENVSEADDRVVLDLSAVEFMDSTGLGVLVSLLKRMGKGGRIAVCGANAAVTRLFSITRLDTLFTLCASEQDAVDALR